MPTVQRNIGRRFRGALEGRGPTVEPNAEGCLPRKGSWTEQECKGCVLGVVRIGGITEPPFGIRLWRCAHGLGCQNLGEMAFDI